MPNNTFIITYRVINGSPYSNCEIRSYNENCTVYTHNNMTSWLRASVFIGNTRNAIAKVSPLNTSVCGHFVRSQFVVHKRQMSLRWCVLTYVLKIKILVLVFQLQTNFWKHFEHILFNIVSRILTCNCIYRYLHSLYRDPH